MYFVFDGVDSSAYNLMIGSYNGARDEDATLGTLMTINSVKAPRRSHWIYTDSVYEEPLSFSFPICKMDCTNIEDKVFTREEIAAIMMWLVRDDGYHYLSFNDEEYGDVYYNCYITLEQQIVGNDTVGFQATITCDAPWGWSGLMTHQFTSVTQFSIASTSEGYGVIYPDAMRIVMQASGNLLLTNTVGDKSITTEVDMLRNGESILFDKNHAIYSGLGNAHPNLFDDFNYVFPGIYRTPSVNMNAFESNLPITVSMTYREIRKGVVV